MPRHAVAVPSSGIVNSVIRITGIGDRDRPEWLIRINGIRIPGTLQYEYLEILISEADAVGQGFSCELAKAIHTGIPLNH